MPLNLDPLVSTMSCTRFSQKFWQIDWKEFHQKLSQNIKVLLQKIDFSNNMLVAFESLHSMQKHIGNDDFMVIKLDMGKVYDKVE